MTEALFAFDRATAIARVDDGPGGVARFRGHIEEGWDIDGVANGGYVLAIVGRAITAAAGRPPLSTTAHFLAPSRAGECTIDVTTVRVGRRTTTVSARLLADDRELVRVLGTCADTPEGAPLIAHGPPPHLPPFDRCVERPVLPGAGLTPSLMQHLSARIRPDDTGFATGEPSGRPEMCGWFAFRDHRPIDVLALLLVADAFPPAVFNSGVPVRWTPTIDLTVHVRATPVDGPLQVRFRTRHVAGGVLDEEGELWDRDGTLVAQSRQLALVPR
jgi:acyl-CoA thioesterase